MPESVRHHRAEDAGNVVELDTVRERALLQRYRAQLEAKLAQNRQALAMLYETGLLFSRSGTRTGRSLLGSHEQLLRLSSAVSQAERGLSPTPLSPLQLDALFVEIETLLEKTSELARRNRSLFETRRGR